MRALWPWWLLLVSCSSAAPASGTAGDASLNLARPSELAPEAAAPPVVPAPAPAASANLPQTAPQAPSRPRTHAVKPSQNGCVLESEQTLSEAELALALYLDGSPAVVTFARGALGVWVAVANGEFSLGPQVALESPALRAAAACSGASCELAWVDERARLLAVTIEPARVSPKRLLASGVDRRFAPALAQAGGRVHYAYTTSVEEAMHTLWIARHGDALAPPRDLTPEGHGAAASTFVLGATEPTLVFIDAHAGISPLLELRFDAAGKPGPVSVRTPVSQPYAPPLLSAVQWTDGRVEVVFSAVGRAAMTAIARVPLRTAADPTALLPSSGYGPLAFSAARSRRRALFALELPSASAPDSPRKLALKLLDGVRTDPVLELGPGSHGPALASGPQAGSYALAYVRAGHVEAARIRCDD